MLYKSSITRLSPRSLVLHMYRFGNKTSYFQEDYTGREQRLLEKGHDVLMTFVVLSAFLETLKVAKSLKAPGE